MKHQTFQLGARFGKLVIVARYPKGRVLCRCDCGTEVLKWTGSLKSFNHSCGCARTRAVVDAAEPRPFLLGQIW